MHNFFHSRRQIIVTERKVSLGQEEAQGAKSICSDFELVRLSETKDHVEKLLDFGLVRAIRIIGSEQV